MVLIVLLVAFMTTAPTGEGSRFAGTVWSLAPPLVAIILALITKEVYSSLFIGIAIGAIFAGDGNIENAMNIMFESGFITVLSDSWNVGILIFLVILGTFGALALKTGGTRAYGEWALAHIHSRKMAQLATMILGCVIFIDDYFNCLTVGSVMRPVTDAHKVSRAKLAYLIDSTAAPICIIAPISSWAAAVSGAIGDAGLGDVLNPYTVFTQSIEYNFYAIFTIIAVLCIIFFDINIGPMKRHEENAEGGDLFTVPFNPNDKQEDENVKGNGKVIDLILPIFLFLIPGCILGLMYTGGFFSGASIQDSFANCDASVGLVYGSGIALILSILYFMLRRVLKFDEVMNCLPLGFRNMVPAILILIFAWTLCEMTRGQLDSAAYVKDVIKDFGGTAFLPAIFMLIACFISFSTGTSWGTFGILLPIVLTVFDLGDPLMIVGVSACLAGSVFGDHCSPISDTTIMSSAGAQCNHIEHVSTQTPYALIVAGICFVFFLIAGFWQSIFVTVIGAAATVLVFYLIKKLKDNDEPATA